jgi:putative hemolysin
MQPRSRRRSRFVVGLVAAAALAALAGCGMPEGPSGATTSPTVVPPPLTPTGTTTPTGSPTTPSNGAEAAAYCRESGGTVQARQPTFGTNNNPNEWISLGDPVEVCRFEAADQSRIYLDLVTLHSTQPTLAALAYLAKAQMPTANPNANPASVLCAALGGTDQFGPQSVAGGGLVDKSDTNFVVITPCTFADGSWIDEWGIAYYSADDIRGKDLKTVFRFNTNSLPPIFPS